MLALAILSFSFLFPSSTYATYPCPNPCPVTLAFLILAFFLAFPYTNHSPIRLTTPALAALAGRLTNLRGLLP